MIQRRDASEQQVRRGIKWTAILLGLTAVGFYVAFIIVTGASSN